MASSLIPHRRHRAGRLSLVLAVGAFALLAASAIELAQTSDRVTALERAYLETTG